MLYINEIQENFVENYNQIKKKCAYYIELSLSMWNKLNFCKKLQRSWIWESRGSDHGEQTLLPGMWRHVGQNVSQLLSDYMASHSRRQ
jgi:hypothetical protein